MSNTLKNFCINTYSYTLDWAAAEAMKKISETGYGAVELMMYPGHLWPAEMSSTDRSDLRKLVADLGLEVTTINMPNIDLNIAGATLEMREYSLSILEEAVRMAGDLGAPHIIVGPGKSNPLLSPPREELISHLSAGLDRLCAVSEEVGTGLLLENMPFSFLPSAKDLKEFLDHYGNSNIGIIYDVANGHFIDEDPCAELRLLKDRVKVVHFSDTFKTVYRHDAVGLGDVDFASVSPVLKEIGYINYPVLEVISHSPDSDILMSSKKLSALGIG